MNFRHIVLGCALLVACSAFGGSVIYDAQTNVVLVRDFLEDTPATADSVLAADREHGWDIIQYDAAEDVYTLDASLYIGDDKNLGAFFQVGRPEHPRETLIVRGDVWVRPPRESPLRTDGRPAIVNRLTLGNSTFPSIHATLKIACEKRGQYGVYVGIRNKSQWISRGDIHVYNSTITAATPDRQHALTSRGWYGSSFRLLNATLSWIDGNMTYGINRDNSVIDGTTFEHGGCALRNGKQFAKNCMFRYLDTAIAEGGCLDATLVNCTFANNQRNWTLGSSYGRGIRMIDCTIGPQSKPIQLRKNKVAPKRAAMRGIPIYPCYSEWTTVVVKVVNGSAAPLFAAAVNVECAQDPNAVENPLVLTDANGMTPQRVEDGTILITTRRLQATDTPGEPRSFSFEYRLTVSATGFKEKTLRLRSGRPIPKPIVVVLEK